MNPNAERPAKSRSSYINKRAVVQRDGPSKLRCFGHDFHVLDNLPKKSMYTHLKLEFKFAGYFHAITLAEFNFVHYTTLRWYPKRGKNKL